MTMTVDIPKTGFVLNETIPIDLDVKNPSSEDVSCFQIKIFKTIESFANDGNDRTDKEDVVVVDHLVDGLLVGDDRKFRTEILVPNTPPTDITSSTIFKLSYLLRVRYQNEHVDQNKFICFLCTGIRCGWTVP